MSSGAPDSISVKFGTWMLTKNKGPISTQRQAQPINNFSAKRGCLKKTKAPISTQRQAQPVHNFSAKREGLNKNQGSEVVDWLGFTLCTDGSLCFFLNILFWH